MSMWGQISSAASHAHSSLRLYSLTIAFIISGSIHENESMTIKYTLSTVQISLASHEGKLMKSTHLIYTSRSWLP